MEIGSATREPAAIDVVSNYPRGWVLFGVDDSRDLKFEWRHPHPRAVITPETARISKRIRAIQRRSELEVRFNQDFDAIMERCREGRSGWLTEATVDLYRKVDELGFISTVGAYRGDQLVGGFWGVGIGGSLGMMSMFHREDHAGTLAIAAAVDSILAGERSMLDCGGMNENFKRCGAQEVSARRFTELVWAGIR